MLNSHQTDMIKIIENTKLEENDEVQDFISFIGNMMKELGAHVDKCGWKDCEVEYLFDKLKEHLESVEGVMELSMLKILNGSRSHNTIIDDIVKDLIDISNYSMMLASNLRRSL